MNIIAEKGEIVNRIYEEQDISVIYAVKKLLINSMNTHPANDDSLERSLIFQSQKLMSYALKFTTRARNTYVQNPDYLQKEWGTKVTIQFIDRVDTASTDSVLKSSFRRQYTSSVSDGETVLML